MNNDEKKAIVKDWTLACDALHGVENRDRCARALYELYIYPNKGKIEMPGICFLCGEVYGKPGYTDGSTIRTSFVKTAERIGDEFCIETVSGNEYYFLAAEGCFEMMRLFRDMSRDDVKQEPGFYLDQRLRDFNNATKPPWAKYI